ncbi:kelch-like protein 30 [Liolophura sinensis]|uniref:kelch-like protein 30 n=1 Tax=Liolophura sinensis TaxID=3198878 RepID=UPI0031582307
MSEVYNSRVSAFPVELGDWASLLPVDVNGHQLMCQLGVLQHCRIPIAHTQNLSVAKFHVDQSIFEEFVSWLRTGFLNITHENVEGFAYAAFKNNITYLLHVCEQYYLGQLTETSCLELWVIGGNYGCRTLESEALRLVRENFENVIKSDSWLSLDIHHVKLLVNDKSVNIHSPKAKRDAVFRWSQYDCGTRTDAWELMNCLPNFSGLDLNSNGEPETSSCSSCCSVLCVGDTGRGLRLFEAKVENNRTLSLNKLNMKVAKTIDAQSAFQYSPEEKRLFACTEHEIWSLKHTESTKLAKLPFDRSKHMICVIMDEVFVLGGYWDVKRTDYIHTYSRRKRKWSTSSLRLSWGLVSGKSVSVGSQVFMFGNQIKDEYGEVYQKKMLQRLDTSRRRISDVLSPPPFPKDNAYVETAVASPHDLIYVFSSHGDLLEYDPKTGSYGAMAPLPCARSRFGTLVHDETLYVFGGQEREVPTRNGSIKSYCLDLNHPNATWRECGSVSEQVQILS